MSDLNQVSEAIGALKATVDGQGKQLSTIFGKLDDIAENIGNRSADTSTRLNELEGNHTRMDRDLIALTASINTLSRTINDAKLQGWKAAAMFFAVSAASGVGGATIGASLLKGLF